MASPARILMIGDSITQRAWTTDGTGSAMQDYYVRRFDVINRGYSGYNTTFTLLAAPTFLHEERNVELTTIFLGANDAVLEFRTQYTPLPEFKQKLKQLHAMRPKNSRAEQCPVIFITPPPVSIPMRKIDVLQRWGEVKMDREVERTRKYAHAVVEVANELGCPYVELHDSMEAAAIEVGAGDRDKGLANFLDDGLHLAPEGYRFLTARLKQAIERDLPHLKPDALPPYMPLWEYVRSYGFLDARSRVDPKDPAASFPKPPVD